MADTPIILNNAGNDQYNFLARDWATNPVKCKQLKIFLADDSQLKQTLTITSQTSTGASDIRKLSFSKYTSSLDKNNLILTIPLKPELILNGRTFFKLKIPALSQVVIVFFYEQEEF